MASQLPIALPITLAIMFSSNAVAARAPQKTFVSAQKQVADTANTIFSAASTEESAKLHSVIAPDLHISANGKHQIAWEERER